MSKLTERLPPFPTSLSPSHNHFSTICHSFAFVSWRGYPLDGLVSMLFLLPSLFSFFLVTFLQLQPTTMRACTVVCDCRGHYLLSVTATAAAALLSAYCDGFSPSLATTLLSQPSKMSQNVAGIDTMLGPNITVVVTC